MTTSSNSCFAQTILETPLAYRQICKWSWHNATRIIFQAVLDEEISFQNHLRRFTRFGLRSVERPLGIGRHHAVRRRLPRGLGVNCRTEDL